MELNRATVTDELNRLKAELVRMTEIVEHLEGTLAYFDSPSVTATKTSPTLNEAACAILRSIGKPVHRKILYAKLTESGVRIAGQDPVGNMTAHFSHDARFDSFGDGLWGLVEWKSVPPAGAVLGPKLRRSA